MNANNHPGDPEPDHVALAAEPAGDPFAYPPPETRFPGVELSGDELAVARIRYAVALMLSPHLSRYFNRVRDVAAVVDDVTEKIWLSYDHDDAQVDIGAFIGRYIAEAEGRAPAPGQRRSKGRLTRLWQQRAELTRQRLWQAGQQGWQRGEDCGE